MHMRKLPRARERTIWWNSNSAWCSHRALNSKYLATIQTGKPSWALGGVCRKILFQEWGVYNHKLNAVWSWLKYLKDKTQKYSFQCFRPKVENVSRNTVYPSHKKSSRWHSKIIRHTVKQENTNHDEGKNWLNWLEN